MTKRNTFIAGNILLLVLLLGAACGEQQGKQVKKNTEITAVPDSIAVIPFEVVENGWGYKINKGAHTFIYQDIIPCIQGRHHFRSREDALKVGERVAAGLRENPGSLPILTREDLLAMKIAGVE